MILKCAQLILPENQVSLHKLKPKAIQKIFRSTQFILFLIILSILCKSTFGQVRIKEKVEITPKVQNKMETFSTSETHMLKAVVEWDTTGGLKNSLRARFRMFNVCTEEEIISEFINYGYIELQMSINSASTIVIETQPQSNNYPIDNSWFNSLFLHSLKVFVDGELVNTETNTSIHTSVKPWGSDLILNIGSWIHNEYNDALCKNESVPFYIDDVDCNPIYWSTNEGIINISIIEGAQFTSFYSEITEEFIGDNVFYHSDIFGNYFTDWGSLHLKYDEEYTESSEPKEVILEASINGLTARDTIIIYPSSNIFRVAGEIQDFTESIIRWEKISINAWLESSGYCEGIVEPPENSTFTAEIIKGNKYGGVVDPSNGKTSSLVSGLTAVNGQVSLEYFADGEIVENPEEILIKITSSIEDSEPEILSFIVKPSGLFITADPEEISLSDSSNIEVFWYNEMGSLELVPEDYAFQVEIIDGAQYGDIFDPISSESGDLFNEIYQGFSFKPDSLLEEDSAEVYIRVSTLVFGGGFSGKIDSNIRANVNRIENSNNEHASYNSGNGENQNNKSPNSISKVDKTLWATEIYGICKIDISNKTKNIEIMLGESKYFQAIYPDPSISKLVIEEVEPGENGIPALDGGLPLNVWGINPASIVNETDTSGRRLGIYWETQKPMSDGNNLQEGLIRLIGRFWHKDSSYVVKLKAKRNNDSTEVNIKVILPKLLLTEGQPYSYSRTRDVNNNIINIDSLCFIYGGINGIPPHFIKGQIFQESEKIDFGGEVGWGFAPSYRYEPYTIQVRRAVLENMTNNPFYITENSSVSPPNHQHVRLLPYFSGDTISVWEIVREYSQIVEDGSTPETRLYGTRTYEDTMNYNAYPNIRNHYRNFFDETINYFRIDSDGNQVNLTLLERADTTNKIMADYLRDDFRDGIGTTGMRNMIAQTRIASSYGYLQALYTTAIDVNQDWNYPQDADHPPEDLNKVEIFFPMATRMQKNYLLENLTENNESTNNWSIGFEEALRRYILEEWNTHDNYPSSVFTHINNFIPHN